MIQKWVSNKPIKAGIFNKKLARVMRFLPRNRVLILKRGNNRVTVVVTRVKHKNIIIQTIKYGYSVVILFSFFFYYCYATSTSVN